MQFKTQSPEKVTLISHKKSPHSRGNFSKCGKLCDQRFYLEGTDLDLSTTKLQPEDSEKKLVRRSSTAFTSVPRQRPQNFRFSNPQPVGEFTYYPNHTYGRSKSPTWSFPKKERYGNEKIQQYEICRKHPIARFKQQDMLSSSSTIKETVKNNLALTKSSSMNDTMAQTQSKNYSIIMPRKTSAINFFSKTKIKNPFYLSKVEIMNEEEKLQDENQSKPKQKGYVEFFKKKPRQPNKNVKGFETFLDNYTHENQFNNFSFRQHPTSPNYHINFDQHLPRKFTVRQTKCPNMDVANIDPIRILTKNVSLNISKFRERIITRFDRAEPEPNTRIQYDTSSVELGGMVPMDKVIPRSQQLFPVVDPAIKKSGDNEMREGLRRCIPTKQINEAMRPKCNTKIEV